MIAGTAACHIHVHDKQFSQIGFQRGLSQNNTPPYKFRVSNAWVFTMKQTAPCEPLNSFKVSYKDGYGRDRNLKIAATIQSKI